MDIVFIIYPLLLAGTLGLWWLPLFFWKDDPTLQKIAGVLLWWVNIPLYCLMAGPGLEKTQPFLTGTGAMVAKGCGVFLMVGGIIATLCFVLPRWKAGGPGYEATQLQIKGIFAIMRHPQLGSAWLIAAGFALWQGALFALVSAFGFMIVLRMHAHLEEKLLLVPIFGDDYLEYRKKVKAFVPYVI